MGEPAIRIETGKERTQFRKGQSGNPTGRPKGIAGTVRALSGGSPDRLVTGLLEIAENPKAKDADRIRAFETLLDRGWGKAPTYAPIEGEDPLEYDEINRFIQSRMDELAALRARKTGGNGAGGPVVGASPG